MLSEHRSPFRSNLNKSAKQSTESTASADSGLRVGVGRSCPAPAPGPWQGSAGDGVGLWVVGFFVLRHGSSCLQGVPAGPQQGSLGGCCGWASSGPPPPPPTLGEGLRNAAWILGSYGAAADGPGGQGVPPTSPALPGPGWLCRQPLVVREGPFVYQDKEKIEKFLRAEWGLASMTMVTACSSLGPLGCQGRGLLVLGVWVSQPLLTSKFLCP